RFSARSVDRWQQIDRRKTTSARPALRLMPRHIRRDSRRVSVGVGAADHPVTEGVAVAHGDLAQPSKPGRVSRYAAATSLELSEDRSPVEVPCTGPGSGLRSAGDVELIRGSALEIDAHEVASLLALRPRCRHQAHDARANGSRQRIRPTTSPGRTRRPASVRQEGRAMQGAKYMSAPVAVRGGSHFGDADPPWRWAIAGLFGRLRG